MLEMRIIPLRVEGEIRAGDSLADWVELGLHAVRVTLRAGDVLVVKHKVVSKAEGQIVALDQQIVFSRGDGPDGEAAVDVGDGAVRGAALRAVAVQTKVRVRHRLAGHAVGDNTGKHGRLGLLFRS